MLGVEWPFTNEQVAFYVEAGLSARQADIDNVLKPCLLYTSPSPRDRQKSRMPSSA